MSNDSHAEGKRNAQSVGCIIMMAVIALVIVGLLIWILLWGRSIPAAEESKNRTPQSSIVKEPKLYI